MEYPKLQSLYKRDGYDFKDNKGVKVNGGKLIIGEYSCPEFEAVKQWTVTEKVDGMNVRVIFDRNAETVEFKGRTDNSLMPPALFKYLNDTFTYEKMAFAFEGSKHVVLYGEGYGGKIQAGNYYTETPKFILFDVFCSGWWLTRDDVKDTAAKLDVYCVPWLCTLLTDKWDIRCIYEYVKSQPNSLLAKQSHVMEGIVARSEPLMLFRNGKPLMFKLKCKDLL